MDALNEAIKACEDMGGDTEMRECKEEIAGGSKIFPTGSGKMDIYPLSNMNEIMRQGCRERIPKMIKYVLEGIGCWYQILGYMYGHDHSTGDSQPRFSGSDELESIKTLPMWRSEELNWGLCGACEGGNEDIAEMMIKLGANNYEMAFHGACRYAQIKMIQMLMKKGIRYVNSGLRVACRCGHMDVACFLIKEGATDMDGGLYNALESGNEKLVLMMIEYGATIRSK